MTPLLAILLLATPPTTIHPTTHQRSPTTMTQPILSTSKPSIQYPIRHPNTPIVTTRARIGMDASNPQHPFAREAARAQPIEHTQRPR
jgi:hypothetical protein